MDEDFDLKLEVRVRRKLIMVSMLRDAYGEHVEWANTFRIDDYAEYGPGTIRAMIAEQLSTIAKLLGRNNLGDSIVVMD